MSLQGSKPRKLVKRTNFNNPTFHSFSMMEAFNPEVQFRDIKKHAKSKQLRNDSLIDAERRFDEMRSNGSSPYQRSSSSYDKTTNMNAQILNKKLDSYHPAPKITQQIQNKSSLRASPSSSSQMTKLNKFYNYMGSDSIKYKQYHGFNIISGIPGYYG